jgi:hypothetical protein
MDTNLRVVAVAIHTPDGLVFTKEAPARHHDVIRLMTGKGIETMGSDVAQGFLLSDGRFCRRKPAKLIARKANQLLPRACDLEELFSEDVW